MAEREALGVALSAPQSRLERLARLGPLGLFRLLLHKTATVSRRAWWRLRDPASSSYALGRSSAGELAQRFASPDLDLLVHDAQMIRGVSAMYLAHRFDLLGSGWAEVRHGAACRGLQGIRFDPAPAVMADRDGAWLENRINPANRAEARRLWRLTSADYRPIDWQLDFKSGFRWSERERADDLRFGDARGADVKVPWELARMQHAPLLAHAYRLAAARHEGFHPPERYAREFADQALDFIATNPPRFGVNWASPMDVSIRAANLLAARDLFIAAGARFDAGFERVFERSMYEHGRHVRHALEWHPKYRGNHYLCEVAGLMFIAAYLASDDEILGWRELASRALAQETRYQFLNDGGNIEASTGYHRLSGEAVTYATALAPGEFDANHYERLAAIARFVEDGARPDGAAPQIGDQDSGRFLKLAPRFHRMTAAQAKEAYATLDDYRELPPAADYWDEDLRDHRHIVAAVAGLLGTGTATAAHWRLEQELVAGLPARTVQVRGQARVAARIGDPASRDRLLEELRALPPDRRVRYEFDFGAGARQSCAFPDFGLYVFKTDVSYVCVRCGPIGNHGLGAHAHNDALSVELRCMGRDIARDPGSYLYTPLPEERDRYRSVKAHFAPQVAKREPARLGPGVFRLGDEAQARCLYFGDDGFLGVHSGYGAPVHRLITFVDTMLVIEDYAETDVLEAAGGLGPDRPFVPVPFSAKYGARER